MSLLNKNWQIKTEKKASESLFDVFIRSRNLKLTDEFISPQKKHLTDPFLFSDMQKAVERVQKSIKKGEKILVFGDYDLDGISGSAIMFKTLKQLNANVSVWLPSRADGFGLNKKFTQEIIKRKFNLLITVDTGISDFEHITKLLENGIDTIITDHHSIPKKIPETVAILHPNEHETAFVGAGVAMKFSQALLDKDFTDEYLELAMLGTIADIGNLSNENRTIVALGLEAMRTTKNEGLQSLCAISNIQLSDLNEEKIAFSVAPRLNASGRVSHPMHSLELLLGNRKKAQLLEQLNEKRREMSDRFLKEILKNVDKNSSAIIVKSSASSGIIGLLAGRLTEQFSRPSIVLCEENGKMKASCRSVEDFNIIEALRKIPEHFEVFGGHAEASGFTLRNNNIDKFKKDFLALSDVEFKEKSFMQKLNVDAELIISDLNLESLEALLALAPFGAGFSEPIFSVKNPEINDLRLVGANKNHLFARIAGFSSIMFNVDSLPNFQIKEIAFTPQIEEWNGEKQIKLRICDIR